MEQRGERRGDFDGGNRCDSGRYDKCDTVLHAQITGARNELARDLVIYARCRPVLFAADAAPVPTATSRIA